MHHRPTQRPDQRLLPSRQILLPTPRVREAQGNQKIPRRLTYPPMNKPALLALALAFIAAPWLRADDADPLAPWRSGVIVHPVTPHRDRHVIHSYFNTRPESPDGKYVLYYTSTTAEGESG